MDMMARCLKVPMWMKVGLVTEIRVTLNRSCLVLFTIVYLWHRDRFCIVWRWLDAHTQHRLGVRVRFDFCRYVITLFCSKEHDDSWMSWLK
jgi:hypothetical protein